MNEHAAQVGVDYTFWWAAPAPLTGTPTASFRLDAGTVAPVLVTVQDEAAITAVADDRRTLTASPVLATYEGAAGERGDAYLVTPGGGWYPVRVEAIENSGARVVLADPLPHGVDLTGGAALEFAYWSSVLTSATYTAVAERDVPVAISYVKKGGANVPDEDGRDEMLYHVVRQPFATDLTHHEFVAVFASMGGQVPRGQTDFAPQIAAALEELGQYVDSLLEIRNLHRDDIPAAERLQNAHGYYTYARILEAPINSAPNFEDAAIARERGRELAELALRAMWVDSDQDGDPSAGETGTQLTQGLSTDVAGFGLSTDRADITLPFTWDQEH